ncbi:MAG: ParB N-terminal domain-containing protein [Saprospiraceae bacterium]|nr:ParB N-terminal domain-containing protein [Saprospiraceae bacterium]
MDIADLHINIENPRFEMVGNQREAIKTMIEDQGEKLAKLAEDITNEGLNPGDPIFVTKHEKQPNQYNVLEGNRRVTALKLLENPDLIPETNKSLLNKFKSYLNNTQNHLLKRCLAYFLMKKRKQSIGLN